MDISSSLTPVIPVPHFNAVAGAYGYVDTEAIVQNLPGSTYWNVNDACQRYYNGGIWACGSGTVIGIPVTIAEGGTSATTVPQADGNLGVRDESLTF